MPGVVLEEAFSIARYHNTIGSVETGNQFVIGPNPVESTVSPTSDNADVSDDSDYLALTIQGEGIKLFNTSDQKCLKSWTTPPGVVFADSATHRVDLDSDDGLEYTYALIASGTDIPKSEERRTVWLWKDTGKRSTSSVNDRTTKTFDDHIQKVHVSPAMKSHVILVNENGSVVLATKDLDRITAKGKVQRGNIVWSTVFVTPNAHTRPCCISNTMAPPLSTIVATVSNVPGSSTYTFRLNYINEERRSVDVLTSIDITLKEKPVAFTLDSTDGRFTTLGSKGKWTIWQLSITQSMSKITGRIEEQRTIALDDHQIYNERLGATAAIVSLSDSYVALVAPRSKGDTQKVQVIVSVWDLKYGTLQAERSVLAGEKDTFEKDKCICKIAVLANSHLAITVSSIERATGKSGNKRAKQLDAKSLVTLCPYYSEPMSLMGAMGKMRNTAKYLGIDDDQTKSSIGYTRSDINAVGLLPNTTSQANFFEDWSKLLYSCERAESEALSPLLSPSLDAKEFTELFFKQMDIQENKKEAETEDVVMEEAADNEPLDDSIHNDPLDVKTLSYRKEMEQWMRTHRFGFGFKFSHHFILNVVHKCFRTKNGEPDTTFWPISVVLFLMSKHVLHSHHVENGIIRQLMARDQWALIPIALEFVNDIPEADLVYLIKGIIKKQESGTDGWAERFAPYLQKIIDSPHNEIFMQQALRRITPSELPILLETIETLMQVPNTASVKSANSLDNLVQFANSLLDIHFTTVILEPSLYESVQTLMAIVRRESVLAEEMEKLRAMLKPFERKAKQARIEKQKAKQAGMPTDEVSRLRKKLQGKFGGEQGIPVYRVEVFRF